MERLVLGCGISRPCSLVAAASDEWDDGSPDAEQYEQ
jgi:hypothetical protein